MIAKIFVSSDLSAVRESIIKNLKDSQLKKEHADVLYLEAGEKLGIEQARLIKEFLAFKPFQAKGRGIVIEDLSGITVDAQNALLKILEEPPEEALILLGTTTTHHLLPTVLSRCQIIQLDSEITHADFSTVEKILALDTEGRFKAIEKNADKDQLLTELIQYIEFKFQKNPQYLTLAKEILAAEGWQKANVNVRGILEYLMLVIPTNY